MALATRVVTIAFVLSGCATSDTIVVAGASSLAEALSSIETAAEATLGLNLAIDVAGSQAHVAAIAAGSPIDVIIAADRQTLEPIESAGLITIETAPVAFNQLAIIVETGNPLGLDTVASLTTVDRLVLAAPEVPLGRYTANLAGAEKLRPKSWETSARQLVGRIANGEADAGIGYVSDGAAEGVEAIPISNSTTTYWIGVSPDRDDLGPLIAYLYGDVAQTAFEEAGLRRSS
ncbi:MAG: substrate-binding domain-containing protein [Acidimicrobiia bacterium]|nr:substrate-binding domain-containing protein [Acidimicrobiia bacterium]NNC41903.1 solute-binding protein [Acidimicrobiia bacterium]NND14006.1 solute-binding protein [Acidimicrobiia bacterium]NNL29049.1 solute-binding protein [Acidimicrobiia bacterium]